jgi:hypothetical protein
MVYSLEIGGERVSTRWPSIAEEPNTGAPAPDLQPRGNSHLPGSVACFPTEGSGPASWIARLSAEEAVHCD